MDILRTIWADNRLRLLAVTAAFYALFSQPTPDSIGIAEFVVGGALLLVVGVVGAYKSFSGYQAFNKALPLSLRVLSAAFLIVFVQAILATLIYQNSPSEAVRDIVPFFYFMQPVLLSAAMLRTITHKHIYALAFMVAGVGVIYSVRHFLDAGVSFRAIGSGFYNSSGYYFSTDPSVLFAALFFLGVGIAALTTPKRGGLVAGGLMLGLSMVALAALAVKGHRGPIAMFAMCAAGMVVFMPGPFLKRVALSAVPVGVIAFMARDKIMALFWRLLQKQQAHGINGRDLEARAVFDHVGRDALGPVIGNGFGSIFENPVLLYKAANFTHFSPSFLYLKAGLLGVALSVIYVLAVGAWGWRTFRRDAVIAFSCAGPLLIGFFINGSFRYLTFGWIAAILAFAAVLASHRAARSASIMSQPCRPQATKSASQRSAIRAAVR